MTYLTRIPHQRQDLAHSLLLAGETTRSVARLAGINFMTAWKLQKRLIAERGPILCRCGKDSRHKGFCGYRIANSPKRIAWLLGHMRDIEEESVPGFGSLTVLLRRLKFSK